ncbi:tyrosinase family protein [Roseibium sp. Sym1]|uniref:tyrosinase family protein n=1 Tax=Roseibium sp. Sym1 TaxID=3016006 RepID=UPI0022B5DF91|nr:tyrosinase family protein [Roseibium sp. Sym1]
MAGTRENIFVSTQVRDAFLQAMVALDQPNSGVMASDLANFLQANNLPMTMIGEEQELSIYDIFVFWHVLAMNLDLSVGNAAHGGPIFLPWHRMYMIRLEQMCQQVLGDPDFGLPYWDWAADGELPVQEQWRTDLWSADYLGEARGRVRSGPLAQMQVRLVAGARRREIASVTPRPVFRQAGMDRRWPDLPTQAQVDAALDQTEYDVSPWGRGVISHRNILEGWVQGPQLHNRVHTWIGGDMAPGTSPNDPAFFLNHCNVDRIWELWMGQHGLAYAPGRNRGPQGHRIDSTMFSIIGQALTPEQILDPSAWYAYDHQLIA